MTGFWRTWLWGWCWAVALFGVVLMGGAFEATAAPARLFYELLNPSEPFELTAAGRISLALLGAVTLGWSITFAAAFQGALLLGERGKPVWVTAMIAVLVWYVVDSALSVVIGYWPNALSNTLFVAAFLLPLLRSGVLKG